jgi:hypothetical protein
MAANIKWPKWMLINHIKYRNTYFLSTLSFNKPRTKGIYRIGPHNIDILSVLICGMLGDWWGDKLKNQNGYSVRFNVEQSVSNAAYIHHLTNLFYNWGYTSYIIPKCIKKTESGNDKRSDLCIHRFNYRLTLYTFSSFIWIYDSFYIKAPENGVSKKKVPEWIEEYITPIGLAHWIMQDGSRQKNLLLHMKNVYFCLGF